MSALTGSHRDRNDHGIREYWRGQFFNTLTVFKFQRLVCLRNSEALLPPPPPPLHTAAELIKTPTFNKTPRYHNIKPRKKKKSPWARLFMHAQWVPFLQDARPADFQTPITRCLSMRTVLCVFSVALGICRLFPSRHVYLQICLFSIEKPTSAW